MADVLRQPMTAWLGVFSAVLVSLVLIGGRSVAREMWGMGNTGLLWSIAIPVSIVATGVFISLWKTRIR